jgi:hypothetical protein
MSIIKKHKQLFQFSLQLSLWDDLSDQYDLCIDLELGNTIWDLLQDELEFISSDLEGKTKNHLFDLK